jgi:20S proteasome alpha/beta subunit
MTTIAYKNGVLATDTKASDGDLAALCTSKVYETADEVYAIAGTLSRGLKFVDWLLGGEEGEAPKMKGVTVVCMSKKDRTVTIYEETDYPMVVEDTMYAWGSGSHLAIGAMAHGATPKEAVAIANKWDNGSGLGVQVFRSNV